MEVAGEDLPLPPHGDGGGEGFAARGGADVQHPAPGPQVHRQHREASRRVLYIDGPVPEGRQPLQVPRAGEQQAVRQPGMLLHPDALVLQGPAGRAGGGTAGVHLSGHRGLAVAGGQERLRPLPAQQGQQPLHQPLGMAVADGEVARLVPVRDGGQRPPPPAQPPEDGVDQARRRSPARALRQLHRRMDGGAVRHPVQEQDLIGPDPQDVRQRRLEALQLLGAVPGEVKVQQGLVLDDPVDDPAAQPRVGRSEPRQAGAQRRVRPGPPYAASRQDGQRLPAGAHPRPPPRRPPRSLRPRKIST